MPESATRIRRSPPPASPRGDAWTVAMTPGAGTRSLAAIVVAAVVALVSSAWTAPAAAIDLVFDPKNTAESIKQVKEMRRAYDKLNDQYLELKKQYDQQLVEGLAYSGRDGVRVRIDRRPLGHGVAQRCTDLSNPAPQQKQLCVALERGIVQGRGRVQIADAFWDVSGPELDAGAMVRVVGTDGMTLHVEPAS